MKPDSAPAASGGAAPSERPGLVATYRRLWPYLWPHGRPDLQRRVFLAFGLLIVAKVVTMVTPFTFKWATDALVAMTSDGGRRRRPRSRPGLLGARRCCSIGLYGLSRILMARLTQVRDGLFAKVAMHAVRRLALQTFEHMHALSLRFHLERKTGGLTRVLERGRDGIEELSRLLVLHAGADDRRVPARARRPRLRVRLALLGRRVRDGGGLPRLHLQGDAVAHRDPPQMNDSDTDANTKAVDSLLNFETVKYFGAERREAERYDGSMAKYEKASTQTYVSLAVLNAGQAVIFTVGMTIVMWLAARDIMAGRTTLGGFVLVNTMLMQLYDAAQLHGHDLPRDQTGADRHRRHVPDPRPQPGDRGQAGRAAARRHGRRGAVRGRALRLRPGPADPARASASRCRPGKTVAIVGPSGAGKSTISRLLFRFYEPQRGRILIDGQDIARGQQASLRAAIGMVPQDTVLFNDTIGYNIRYGRWDATPARGARGGRAWRRSTASSRPCRRATTRRSASAASSSRAARSSASPSPAPS